MREGGAAALALAAWAALGASQMSCAGQCAEVSRAYAAEAEAGGALAQGALDEGAPIHVGVAIGYDALGQIASNVVGAALGTDLDLGTALGVGGGKEVPVKLDAEPIEIRLEPDASCKTCFRLAGDLGGEAEVTIPLLGAQKVPLGGAFNLVAPLVFVPQPGGDLIARLDLSRAAQSARTSLIMELDGLPEAIGRALRQPLAEAAMASLAGSLRPVDLFTFRAPDFGLKGVEFFPSAIRVDRARRAVFLGFTTNLPGAGAGLTPEAALGFEGEENFGVALHPGVIGGAVSALMGQEVIPRRYTTEGRASAEGPVRVTMGEVSLGGAPRAGAGEGAEPIALGFRAWNLGGGPCYWVDATASGDVALRDRKLSVDLERVEISDASSPLFGAITQWKSASFLTRAERLLETTLGEPRVALFGGLTAAIAPSSVARDERTIALRSKLTISR